MSERDLISTGLMQKKKKKKKKKTNETDWEMQNLRQNNDILYEHLTVDRVCLVFLLFRIKMKDLFL